MEAQDREGRRIARELHDSAGQIIVALLMKLSAIFEQIKVADPGLGSEVQEALSYAEELNQEIRTMSFCFTPLCWTKSAWKLPCVGIQKVWNNVRG